MSELPEAYAIGWVPFLGARIFLDSRPLIPRPETEYWVEQAIATVQTAAGNRKSLKILDLFAGSGAIGIAVLMHIPEAKVDFGELEKRHFPTIQKNISENGIDPSRTHIIKTDVWSGISDRYDFILANPPYLSNRRVGRIEESVLEYEPPEALFADDDGFGFIAATIADLPKHLAPGGIAWIEHEPEHAERVLEASGKAGLSAESLPDQYDTLRFSRILAVA